MSKYSKRLNEIIGDLSGESFDAAINNSKDYAQIVIDAETKSKQAITSLTKELVAEAKPEIKAHPLGPVTLADCQRGLNHYEANLLKALEEV